MWEFIKGFWRLLGLTFGALKQTTILIGSGTSFVVLQMTMQNNETNIKNKQPLDTLSWCKDLSKLDRDTATYAYGVRLLKTHHPIEVLLKQHKVLTDFINNLDKYPLKDDYTYDVQKLLIAVLTDYVNSIKQVN